MLKTINGELLATEMAQSRVAFWVKIIQEQTQALNPNLTQFMSTDIGQDLPF